MITDDCTFFITYILIGKCQICRIQFSSSPQKIMLKLPSLIGMTSCWQPLGILCIYCYLSYDHLPHKYFLAVLVCILPKNGYNMNWSLSVLITIGSDFGILASYISGYLKNTFKSLELKKK